MKIRDTSKWVEAQLDIYCATPEPGYAILIDAPWGAGKTYGIQSWAGRRKDVVYVSLYGVSAHEEFELRLLEAIFENDKTLRLPKVAGAIESLANRFAGSSLGIADLYRRVALRAAPRVVIIDDIERTLLGANAVFGIVSSLLDQRGHNVILIAHQSELVTKWGDGNDSYLRIKEKVIGRVLPFRPSVSDVIDSFIQQFEPKSTKSKILSLIGFVGRKGYAAMLRSEADVLVSLLERSEGGNLRVLRQSLRDFEQIYPVLIKLVGNDRGKIRSVLATFVALSTLYHGGALLDEIALQQEVSWNRFAARVNGEREEEAKKESIEIAREMFLGLSEVVLDGSIISGDLAQELIAKGDFSADFIEQELLKSPHLVASSANAWRTIWHWRFERPEAIWEALKSVVDSLSAKEIRDPVIILHVFCLLRSMEESGVRLPLKVSVEEYFQKYIEDVIQMNSPKLLRPVSKYTSSLVESNNTGLGFVQEDGSFFRFVLSRLEGAMDNAFWSRVKEDPESILGDLRADPTKFLISIDDRASSNSPNYAHIPVVAFLKAGNLLDELLRHGPSQVATFISVMGRRIKRLEQVEEHFRTFDWPSERLWMKEFCLELTKRTKGSTDSILSAQLALLTTHCRNILENSAIDKPSNGK